MKRIDYLKKRFAEFGITPTKKLGQNFLLDKNQVIKIAQDAEIMPLDTILEVGPGSGLLSCVLAGSGANLLCVEFDRKLFRLVTEELQKFPNAKVIEADILKNKNAINPEVLELISKMHSTRSEGKLKCISNLPYSVATPFIANLCASSLPWSTAVFMIQYEVAERLAAAKGNSSYGNVSIVAQLSCSKVSIERPVPPEVFWPRPNVRSAILKMEFLPVEERMAVPWQSIRRITTAIFSSRRKNLRNSFKGLFNKKDNHKADEFIEFSKIDKEKRGEDFSPEEIRQLASLLDKFEES